MADDISDDHAANRPAPRAPRPAANLDPSGPASRTPSGHNDSRRPGAVVQPIPQTLARRQPGNSSIIVSPRQKGNPILNNIKSMPWEYGDIPADFVLGQTTCALFLQLKYHRLHPEYIYTRIKSLGGKFLLRVVLVMVDIPNHEEALRELSKTSLINNVTLILCWSAAEGGRYLELFKTYENAGPQSIKQHQSTSYSDRMVDFITTPRTINKTDAVALVSTFGTVRTAVNARHEEVATIAGWGDKKVAQWCQSVREPFRIRRAAKRSGVSRENTRPEPVGENEVGRTVSRQGGGTDGDADGRPETRVAEEVPLGETFDEDEEEALAEVMTAAPLLPAMRNQGESSRNKPQDGGEPPAKKQKPLEDPLSDGVMAALSKLRHK